MADEPSVRKADNDGIFDGTLETIVGEEGAPQYALSSNFTSGPGWVSLKVDGFPDGTNFVIANIVSETGLPLPVNPEHNVVRLHSAQLFDNGKKCRVRITVDGLLHNHPVGNVIFYRVAFNFTTL